MKTKEQKKSQNIIFLENEGKDVSESRDREVAASCENLKTENW